MPDNQGGAAGFFGGNVNPEDLKPKDAPKPAAAPAAPATAPGGGAGFLGGAGGAPTPPPPAPASPPPAPAAPVPAAPAKGAGITESASSETPAMPTPAPAASAEVTPVTPPPPPPVAAEPPQPLPPPSASAGEFFTRAEELYDQGFLDSAITAFRRGLEKDPRNTVAINNLSMVFIEKERYEDARNELERALEVGADDAELLSNLGYALRKIGKNPEAADIYERYIAAAPNAEDAGAIGQWIQKVRAEAPLATAAETASAPAASPETSPAPLPQASRTPPAAAAPSFSQPAPAAPASTVPEPAAPAPAPSGDESALIAQGERAFEEERYDESIALFDKALMINFDSVPALYGKGRAQAKAGLLEEGLATLREVATMAPDDPDTRFVIGFILRGMGRDFEAAQSYEKYIDLAPEAENADKIRGWIEEVYAANPQAGQAEEPQAEPEPEEEEGKFKIEKQPAWAASLEEPPPEYQDVGAPEVAPQEPEPGDQIVSIDVDASPQIDAGFIGSSETFGQPEAAAATPEPVAPVAAEPAAPMPEPQAEPVADTAQLDEQADEIRQLLKDGDSATALSKAQELVGRNPGFTAGKILIARCFGQQQEFEKALAILNNVISSAPSDEAYFFSGRSLQELGRNREAKEAFEKCREITDNPDLSGRLDEILREMKASSDLGLCGACGSSVPVQDLQEANGQILCTVCRAQMEKAMGGHAAIAAGGVEAPSTRKRKSAPRRQGSLLGTLVKLIILLVVLAIGAGAGLFYAMPKDFDGLFTSLPPAFRSLIPRASPPPKIARRPVAERPESEPGKIGKVGQPGKKPGEASGKPLEQFVIDSPTLGDMVAGVEYIHQVKASGRDPETITYQVSFSRPPKEKFDFDMKSGIFRWQPTAADLDGQPLEITFGAKSGEDKALEQKTVVRLRPAAKSFPLGPKVPLLPGESVHLATGDLTGDRRDDMVVVVGSYVKSRAIIYIATDSGLKQGGELEFAGRATGVGIGNFGDGKNRVLIADFRSRSLITLGFEGGTLSRLPGSVPLTGRPSLCAFGNPDGSGPMGVAVLIPQEKVIQVFDAVGGGALEMVRQVSLPAEAAWKSLHVADLFKGEDEGWRELALVRLGTAQPNLYTFNLRLDKEWTSLNIGSGVVQAATTGDVDGKPTADMLIATGARENELNVLPGQARGENRLERPMLLEGNEPVAAMQAADLDGNGSEDLVILFRDRTVFRLNNGSGAPGKLARVSDFDRETPPLGPAARGEFSGDRSEDIIYLDRSGRVMLITIPEDRK